MVDWRKISDSIDNFMQKVEEFPFNKMYDEMREESVKEQLGVLPSSPLRGRQKKDLTEKSVDTLSKIQQLAVRMLSPKEALFQAWYKKKAEELGIDPNPDDPRHFYDYRKAWEEGPYPFPEKGVCSLTPYNPTEERPHWPSKFKHPWHPTRFMNGVDTITGKKVTK